MRDLLIVSRPWPDLYETAKGLWEEGEIEVILDRRRAERRQQRTPHVPERRRGDRRTAWAARVHLPEPSEARNTDGSSESPLESGPA